MPDRNARNLVTSVEQYPDLAPPNVRITANYPGASAQTLENTVTQVIEQNMTGLDNLMYIFPEQLFGPGDDYADLYRRNESQRSHAAGTKPAAIGNEKLPQDVQNQGDGT